MRGAFDLRPTWIRDLLPNDRQGCAEVRREEECSGLQESEGRHHLREQSGELLRRVWRTQVRRIEHDTDVLHDDDHEAAANPDDDAALLIARGRARAAAD